MELISGSKEYNGAEEYSAQSGVKDGRDKKDCAGNEGRGGGREGRDKQSNCHPGSTNGLSSQRWSARWCGMFLDNFLKQAFLYCQKSVGKNNTYMFKFFFFSLCQSVAEDAQLLDAAHLTKFYGGQLSTRVTGKEIGDDMRFSVVQSVVGRDTLLKFLLEGQQQPVIAKNASIQILPKRSIQNKQEKNYFIVLFFWGGGFQRIWSKVRTTGTRF